MSHTTRGVGSLNFKLLKKEERLLLKLEDGIPSDGAVSSENMIENRNFEAAHNNQNMLPFKKRSGGSLDNSNPNLTKAPEENTNPWIKMQQKEMDARTEEAKKVVKPEPHKSKILPGVIRHTSCPNNALDYYYNYSVQ